VPQPKKPTTNRVKSRKSPGSKPASKTPSQAKTRQGAPKEEAADSVRETNEPVVVAGNYQPLPVEHRLTADDEPVSNEPASNQPEVHAEAAKILDLAQKDELTPTDTVKVAGETIDIVHSPTNVDPVVLQSHRYDTVLKDRARANGDAHLVDTPNETREGRLRAGDLDEPVRLPGEPKPSGRSTLPPANHTVNEVRRGEEIAADLA